MIICTLGLPGSGKSTVGKLIAEHYDMKFVAAGDVARELAERDEETREALLKGQLAPRDKMNDAMLAHLGPNTVIDNYPRYFEQLLDLHWSAAERPRFVNIMVPFEVAIQRLHDRKRQDDQSFVAVLNRFNAYKDEVIPIIQWALKRIPQSFTVASNVNTPDNTLWSLIHQIDIWRHDA